jgi:hypothetical protein|tara:strand:+ start:3142 stop:4281 length:1140 start_codon:yes stop_codon:yes gene_type:complete
MTTRTIIFLIGLPGNVYTEAAVRWSNVNFIQENDRIIFLHVMKRSINISLFEYRSPIILDLHHQKLEVADLVTPAMSDGSERKFEVCVLETSRDIGEAILQYLTTELVDEIDYSSTFLVLGRMNGTLGGSPSETSIFGAKKQTLSNYMARFCPISTIAVDMIEYSNLTMVASDSVSSAYLGLSDFAENVRTVIIVIDISSKESVFDEISIVEYALKYILRPTDRVKLITFFRSMTEFNRKLSDISVCEDKLRGFLIERPKETVPLTSLILHLATRREHMATINKERREQISDAVNQFEADFVIVRELGDSRERSSLSYFQRIRRYWKRSYTYQSMEALNFNAPVCLVRNNNLLRLGRNNNNNNYIDNISKLDNDQRYIS